MFKLMKLELTKHGNNSLRNWAITSTLVGLGVFALLFMIIWLIPMLSAASEIGSDLLEMKQEVSELGEKALIEMMLNVVFFIYAGVQYAMYVVQDIRKKEVEELFTYPISRTKLMLAKVTLAAILSIVAYVITAIVIMGIFHLMGIPGLFNVSTFVNILINSLVITLVPLGGLYVGLWRESTVVTIVVTFLLASLFQGNMGPISLSQLPIISYIFAAIMVVGLCVMLRIYNEKDFLN